MTTIPADQDPDLIVPARTSPVLGPRAIAFGLTGAIVVLAWVYLGALVGAMAPVMDTATLGPGMGLFNGMGGFLGLDEATRTLLAALCLTGAPAPFGLAMPGEGAWTAGQSLTVFLMWCAMAGAMMLPSAHPMITTYGEIAETAAAKRIRVPSPVVLLAGYLVVLFGSTIVFAILHAALTGLGAMSGVTMGPTGAGIAAVALIGGGIYQLSPIRDACLTKCRSPFSVLFTRWSDRPGRVFRIGVEQGLFCLGCCLGLMIVMFAVGVMNVLWMAALAVFGILEKTVDAPWLGRVSGVALILIGVVIGGIGVF